MIAQSNKWIIGIMSLFIGFMSFALVKEWFWVLGLPVAFFTLYAILYQPAWAFFTIAFFVPLSINTEDFIAAPMALFVPTEPILILLMVIYFFSNLIKPMFDTRIFSHPIFIAYCAYLAWVFISSILSMDPAVSLKYLIAHCWLFFPVFIFSSTVFSEKKNVVTFFWLIISSMTIVAIFTLLHHSMYGFEEKPAHWVMSPFFKDHTSYGAILALLFPPIVGLLVMKKNTGFVPHILWSILVVFALALVFSYTRAAWLSLIGALGVLAVIYFRIRFSSILIMAFGAAFFFIVSFDKIMMTLEKNETDSSADFGDHITSVSNISTDASNVERLNRWDCAIEMFHQKPVTGWGPGTYQFFYAPFQRSENLTIISTNFGDGGNAHSEYLGPLAESGIPGLTLFSLAIVVMFYRGFSNYRKIADKELRIIYISALLGLVTYFIHGFLNNYLDTDKAAVPVWGIAGLIAAVDIFHSRERRTDNLN